MPRITIEVTEEEHKYYKSVAALQGVSLKQLVMGTLKKNYKDAFDISIRPSKKEEIKETVDA